MTFLQLVQAARRECGIPGSGPTTVLNQTGEMNRLVNWVIQSWNEIQVENPEYDFMRTSVTFNTVASQQVYHVGTGLDIDVSDFGYWRKDSFRQYLQSAGVPTEIILTHYYNYSDFRDFYLLGARRTVEGRPLFVTIEPATRALVFGFIPNDVYVTTGEYYRTPQILAADADVPLMPAQYHMAIAYKTMQKYGLFESAGEQIEAGKQGYSLIMNRMGMDQMPMVMQSGSLI